MVRSATSVKHHGASRVRRRRRTTPRPAPYARVQPRLRMQVRRGTRAQAAEVAAEPRFAAQRRVRGTPTRFLRQHLARARAVHCFTRCAQMYSYRVEDGQLATLAALLKNALENAHFQGGHLRPAATAILDRYALVHVDINPESRVKVTQGTAAPELVQAGTRLFLVKVVNEAGVTAPLAGGEPPERPCRYRLGRGARNRPHDHRARHPGSLGRHLALRQAADERTAVGAAARVPHARDLQSRCRPAGRRPVVRRRPGHAGHRLPQRPRHGLHCRACATHHPADRRREGAAGDGPPDRPRCAPRDSIRLPPSASRRTASFSRRSIAEMARSCHCPTASSP